MGFQIQPLPAENFQSLFHLTDKELAQRKARRIVVTEKPGTPCRVSMADADVGDRVILCNYQHQKAHGPFQSSHAIFVREGVQTAKIDRDTVPDLLLHRLISLRMFNVEHFMVGADAVDGINLHCAINAAFEDARVRYIHLHYAKPGCFAASVSRTD